MENCTLNRRAEDRFECDKRASVLFGGRMIEGVLRSISLSGARLELPNPPFGLPPDLDLYLHGDETRYPVRIVWQSGERFGVIFSSATRPDLEICLHQA
jgi:hypothetical protein